MYSSYSMGVLCQMSRNITIDKMSVTAHKGRLFSLAADATHFVNCTGLVKVSNSSFSDQLDDALNVHGIFTRITDVAQDYITVKYMHKSAKGIDIFGAGDKISVKALLYGLMLKSANEAANVLADYISGSTEQFAELMNEEADLNSIKEMLGHSSLATTQVYTHSSFARLKNIYQTAHPRAKNGGKHGD